MIYTIVAALAFLLAISFAISPAFVPDFGGFDADQFPIPQEDPPVQPAGYAFAIWGLIYLWLVIGTGFGLWKRRQDRNWHAMRLPLCASLLVGTFWLAVAVASPVWASVLIWIMLITAIWALAAAPQGDIWWAALPVGLYAGWLTAASSVSLGLLAAGYGWTGQTTAAVLALLIALALAGATSTQLRNVPTYGLGVIWALVAVVVQNLPGTPIVAALAAGGAAALAIPTFRSITDIRNTA